MLKHLCNTHFNIIQKNNEIICFIEVLDLTVSIKRNHCARSRTRSNLNVLYSP